MVVLGMFDISSTSFQRMWYFRELTLETGGKEWKENYEIVYSLKKN
jgi:hypothetical protein